MTGPIGVFDSGYGGLTVLREIVKTLPQYDYLYFGDNARTPYGPRSFQTIYEYTLECVKYLFDQNCSLVILACNTASAKALRTIQQRDLPKTAPDKRVLGVIRPTAEVIGQYTTTRHVGVLGTTGTVNSASYVMEIEKQYADITVHQQACPMWVPLVENGEYASEGADFFIDKYLSALFTAAPAVDTLLLACTHYPLLLDKILLHLPDPAIRVLSQGSIVADSLKDYLHRHPEIASRCAKNESVRFLTTDSTGIFDQQGKIFFGREVYSEYVKLG